MDTSKEFCFCTLAVGARYRIHAKMLAEDIQEHMPDKMLCVLTDQPEQFKECSNVLAFKHQLQSVKGYHDKRFVLDKALSMFESCMFIDADVRILGSFVEEVDWVPGIMARTGTDLRKRMQSINNQKEIQVIEEIAQKLNINLETVQCIHEFMFTVKRSCLEKEFFQLWQTISYAFEMEGFYDGECYAIGLAAAKVGMSIDFFRDDKFPFFKDKIEQIRVQKGQSNPAEKQIYFDIHRSIEHPKRSLVKKIADKLMRQAIFYYRLMRLRMFAKQDPDFYRIFISN